MGKKHMAIRGDLPIVVELFFAPGIWYEMKEILSYCRAADVYEDPSTITRVLTEMVDRGDLMRQTHGGNYRYSLPLKQLSMF